MDYQDFQDLIQTKPIVVFEKGIDDFENYAEAGMIARIIGVDLNSMEDVAKVRVDFSEFEEHNKLFESTGYYDNAGNPVLTARQAGFYDAQDTLYFNFISGQVQTEGIFKVQTNSVNKLFACYGDEKRAGQSWQEWLGAHGSPLKDSFPGIEVSTDDSGEVVIAGEAGSDDFDELIRAGLIARRRFDVSTVSICTKEEDSGFIIIHADSTMNTVRAQIEEAGWKKSSDLGSKP